MMAEFKTEKRKAVVGERILITDGRMTGGYYKNGDVLTVKSDYVGVVSGIIAEELPEEALQIHDREYEVIVGDNTDERLSAAESEITELKRRVSELESELADKSKVTIGFSAEEAGKAIAQTLKAIAKTPNQRRADVIKRAKAFVADLERRAFSDRRNVDGNYLFNDCGSRLEFHINVEKRTVTALAKHRLFGGVRDKAFAKCAPTDVFNADIGKAIALGRALGVDIPQEFFNAPKPTEATDGQIVTFPIDDVDGWYRKVNYRVDGVGKRSDDLVITQDDVGSSIGVRATLGGGLGRLVILDDTDAVYESADSE